MTTIYRVSSRNEGKRPLRLRPSLRRWKHEHLLVAVRRALTDHAEDWGDQRYVYPVYLERVAVKLRAPQGEVDRCFADLNKEGLLTRRVNSPPHDTKRDRFGYATGWQASMYFLQKGRFDV